jgi:hypothetical protein
MSKVLKAGLLFLVISAVVWLITIWRWQTSGLDVPARDIVLQLLVLPVMLSLIFGLALWRIQRLRQAPSAPDGVGAVVPGSAPQAGLVVGGPGEQEQGRAIVWLLDAAVNLRLGQQADQVLSNLASGNCRPGLDPVLQDVDGLPVFSARVDALDEALGYDDEFESSQVMARADGSRPPDAVHRALHLLEPVLEAVLDSVSQLVPETKHLPERHVRAGEAEPNGFAHLAGIELPPSPAATLAKAARRPTLTVRVVLPSTWAEVLDWAEAAGARAVRWQLGPLSSAEALWDEVDALIVQWWREPRPELLLLLALDSAIDEAQIEQRQAVGSLFTAQHQTGKVPGEGAASVLLASPSWPALDRLDAPALQLWRPVRACRDKSADAIGRVGSVALQAALTHALAYRSTQPELMTVISDGDHRASRTAELFEALQALVPGLDPIRQVLRLGEACGDLGVVGALAPLALAKVALSQSDDPEQVALATVLQSPRERVVLVLSQPAQPTAQAV